MHDWLPTVIAALFSGALASAVTAAFQRRPALISAEALANKNAVDGFAALSAELSEQLREARGEIRALRGEIANVVQHMQSLEGILREHNIPIPPNLRPAPLSLVTGAQHA